MKEKIENLLKIIFSLTLVTAILGGGVIFLMFVMAIIIGGPNGEALATGAADTIMPYFIRLASISVLAGLLSMYIGGKHSLSMKDTD